MSDERDLERRLRAHLAAEADELLFEVDAARVRERLDRRRRPSRAWALVPVAAALVAVAVFAGSVLVAGPGPDPSPSGSADASASADVWGPLAVMPGPGSGDAALNTGTLRITDACVLLETADNELELLVWPEDQTHWDPAAGTVIYTNRDGTAVALRDRDPVSFGGGGDSTAESGVSGAEWEGRMEWVAAPDPSCPMEVRWFIGEVVSVGADAPPVLEDPAQAAALVLASDPLFAGIGPRRDYGTDPVAYYEANAVDDGFEVTVHVGWGDCRSGCIYGHDWRFAVSVDGDLRLLEEIGDPLDAGAPDGYQPPESAGGGVTLSGVVGAGRCPVSETTRPACADGPVPGARLVLRDAAGEVVATTQTAPISGRYRLPPVPPGIYLVEPQPVEGLTAPPLVALSLLGGTEAGLDFVYESAEPYRPGTLAATTETVPVHRYVTDTDAPVFTELAPGTQVYLDEGPLAIGGREWFRVKPTEPADWFYGYVSRLSPDGEAWLEITGPPGPLLADEACQPVEPSVLPSGSLPGDIGLYATADGAWYATWGSGDDEVLQAIGHAGSLELPASGAPEVAIRGVTGSLVFIGDTGQVAITWESEGCRYATWLNGLTLDEAADYAGGF